MGVGECAGEVIDSAQFGLAASEREVFEAQLALEAGEVMRAGDLAYRAMLTAARALVGMEYIDVGDRPDEVVGEFRTRFHETGVFHDPFAGSKFAMYLFHTHEDSRLVANVQAAHHRIEEAQLFIEAAHACYDRVQERRARA
jgi:sulfite reductase (ferredoxin)